MVEAANMGSAFLGRRRERGGRCRLGLRRGMWLPRSGKGKAQRRRRRVFGVVSFCGDRPGVGRAGMGVATGRERELGVLVAL